MPTIARVRQSWNYLRVRGEYPAAWVSSPHARELPPRARRIPLPIGLTGEKYGTTSACAENTGTRRRGRTPYGNYLRVRGEYHSLKHYSHLSMELPPRARRILRIRPINQQNNGTTSACAENTALNKMREEARRNYLRVRGEYEARTAAGLLIRELPPRARRILISLDGGGVEVGTTSACAENTETVVAIDWVLRNYLRVRGEYS